MGVMSCNRQGCDNIMCDTYVYGEVGYVCKECQEEFILSDEVRGICDSDSLPDVQITEILERFMRTEKKYVDQWGNVACRIREFFSERTE